MLGFVKIKEIIGLDVNGDGQAGTALRCTVQYRAVR